MEIHMICMQDIYIRVAFSLIVERRAGLPRSRRFKSYRDSIVVVVLDQNETEIIQQKSQFESSRSSKKSTFH